MSADAKGDSGRRVRLRGCRDAGRRPGVRLGRLPAGVSARCGRGTGDCGLRQVHASRRRISRAPAVRPSSARSGGRASARNDRPAQLLTALVGEVGNEKQPVGAVGVGGGADGRHMPVRDGVGPHAAGRHGGRQHRAAPVEFLEERDEGGVAEAAAEEVGGHADAGHAEFVQRPSRLRQGAVRGGFPAPVGLQTPEVAPRSTGGRAHQSASPLGVPPGPWAVHQGRAAGRRGVADTPSGVGAGPGRASASIRPKVVTSSGMCS